MRAQRAVEADGQRLGVAHRVPERFRRLPRQRTTGGIGDGAGNHDWDFHPIHFEILVDREQRGFCIERIENSLDHQNVGAAVDQPAHGFGIGLHQLVKIDVSETGIVDVRRNRRRAVGRTQRAGNKARLCRVFRFIVVRRRARNFRRLDVQLIDQILHVVIRHGDRGRIEGVGLDDVGAGSEILFVDFADDLRLGQRQQIVVALHIVGEVFEALAAIRRLVQIVVLDHRAHRAVENQDAAFEQFGQLLDAGSHG